MSGRARGYILIITLLGIGIMFFYAILIVKHYASEKSLAFQGEQKLVAEQAAIAGMEDSIYQLKKSISWSAGFNKVLLPHSKATYSVSFDKTQKTIPYSLNNYLFEGSKTGYGGRIVPSNTIHLISEGQCGSSTFHEEALVFAQGSQLKVALFGSDSLFLGGTIMIDSYNSDLGTYAQTKKTSGGDIGTNASAYRTVTLRNTTIYGTLRVGPGGSETSTLYKTGTPTYQSFQVAPFAVPMKAKTFPDMGASKGAVSLSNKGTATLAPGTYDSWMAKSSTIVLTPGDYVVNGNITLDSGIISVSQGPVNIYVTGNLSFTSGSSFINSTGKTKNLNIYGGSLAQTIDLKGLSGTELGFTLNVPFGDLVFGGGNDFYGTFVAKTLTVSGNSNFHFDAATLVQQGPEDVYPVVTSRWSW